MNFKISQSNAIKALNNVIGSTDKKDIIETLSHVKIDILDKQATFTTTNLDMQSSDKAEVFADKNFSFLAPVHTLIDIVKKIPSKSEISFTFEPSETGDKFTLEADKIKFQIATLHVNDFPVMPSASFEYNIEIEGEQLLYLLKNTQFSVSNDEVRYNLNGILMHGKDGIISCVSTDGHRLSVCKSPIENFTNLPNSIIPKKAIQEIIKLTPNSKDKIKLSFSDSKVSIKSGNIQFLSKLIDGNFPDYTRVVPTNNNKVIKFNTKSLAQAIERVSIINTAHDNKGIIFEISKNKVNINSKTDSSYASESIECEYDVDESIEIKYNFKYILDAISHIESDKLMFKISSADAPALITADEPDSYDKKYFVVMPMKF